MRILLYTPCNCCLPTSRPWSLAQLGTKLFSLKSDILKGPLQPLAAGLQTEPHLEDPCQHSGIGLHYCQSTNFWEPTWKMSLQSSMYFCMSARGSCPTRPSSSAAASLPGSSWVLGHPGQGLRKSQDSLSLETLLEVAVLGVSVGSCSSPGIWVTEPLPCCRAACRG